VLQQKLEVDARSQKQALAAAAKERHVLEAQISQLQQHCEDRDREARANALAAKQAQRKLEDVKGGAAKAAAGVHAKGLTKAAAVAAEAANLSRHVDDPQVHLMLCIIHDPLSTSNSSSSDSSGGYNTGDQVGQKQRASVTLR